MQEELNQVMAEMPRPQLLEDQPMEQPMGKEYRPSNLEVLREYEISIRFLDRGCIVKVGCKEIAFEDITKAMAEINDYVLGGNTYEAQKKWRKILN
jgi:hypothetical protein